MVSTYFKISEFGLQVIDIVFVDVWNLKVILLKRVHLGRHFEFLTIFPSILKSSDVRHSFYFNVDGFLPLNMRTKP